MSSILTALTVFAEDTAGVLAFAFFALLVYILIGIAFRKYTGRHKRTSPGKDLSAGSGRIPHLFARKKEPADGPRKDFSRSMLSEHGIGEKQTFQK